MKKECECGKKLNFDKMRISRTIISDYVEHFFNKSSEHYIVEVPFWNCPKCGKEYSAHGKKILKKIDEGTYERI